MYLLKNLRKFYVTFIHFRDLYNNEDTRKIALETFEKNKPSMMHVAIQGLEIDLKIVKKWLWTYFFVYQLFVWECTE